MNKQDGLDLLNDLIFFTGLKQLAICYNEKDCEQEDIEQFNNEILENVLLHACININSLAIGGLLNNEGAKVIAQSMQKYKNITGIRILNCNLYEDGVYSILEQGNELEIIDITGCLLSSTGEAFVKNNCLLIETGVLSNLKEIRMSVMLCDRYSIKAMLQKAYGPKVRLVFDGIKLNVK